jgi:hypothetical protein
MSVSYGRLSLVVCPLILIAVLPGIAIPAWSSGLPAVYRGSSLEDADVQEDARIDRVDRGWPFALDNPFGSPAFFDLDGDGIQEVIVADHARAYAIDLQGNVLPGWPRTIGTCDHTPAFGDIDGDGAVEILFGTRGVPPRLYALSTGGTVEPGWPVSLPFQGWLNSSCPVVADINGDGQLDAGIASELGVSFFDGSGAPIEGWPYTWVTSQNLTWSGPAVADLDLDGSLEVVVGNNCLYTESVHVIRADGTAMPGWPRSTGIIFSSPAVADLDGDGDLEIAIQEGDPGWYGNKMHVWHHDGTYLPGWPREIAPQWESSRSNPAIVDLTGDGTLEIVSVTSDGMLHAFNKAGSEIAGFPVATPALEPIASPQVVDVDADGVQEVFLCYYRNGSQWVAGLRLDGSILSGFPKQLLSGSQLNAHGSAHISDPDLDGDLDLVACGTDFDDGSLCFFEIDGSTFDPASTRMDWPKIRHDARNTGVYTAQDPAGVGPVAALPVGLQVFPNPAPARGAWLLLPEGSGGALSVFDAGGRLLLEQSIEHRGRLLPLGSILSDAHRSSGVYWMRWVPRDAPAAPSVARLLLLE